MTTMEGAERAPVRIAGVDEEALAGLADEALERAGAAVWDRGEPPPPPPARKRTRRRES